MMRYFGTLIGALAAVANAHGDFNAPKIVGGSKFMSEMTIRNSAGRLSPVSHLQERNIVERQTSNGRCGAGVGSCTNCCSAAGYCGTGPDYCAAPDCQYKFGPGCDANKVPAGSSTANIARPQLGRIEYGGTGIYDCDVPGEIALTFDDGPYIYTSTLLDKLKAYNAKATFFITGNNLGKGPIDSTPEWSNIIKRMAADGHQIASHTWSHQDLSTLDAATFQKQIVYNEMAFNNILGYFPTYMRPPYSSCDSTCASRLKTLGYHITYFDLDTEGYLHTLPTQIQKSKDIWDNAIRNANPSSDDFLQIEHDIHEQVVHNLTDYILSSMYSKGFKSVPVGDCLRDPKANWYRAGTGAVPSGTTPTSTSTKSASPSSTGPAQAVSTDGSCSASITCQGSEFGNCCSQYGWCGSTVAYCGAGCNPLSGTCGKEVPPSSSSTTAAPPVSPSTTRPPTLPTTASQSPPVTTTTRTTTTTTTSAKPSPTLVISTDGSCGGTKRYTCKGSRYGRCCSSSGRCGSAGIGRIQPYCGVGCQPGFGECN